MDSVDDTHTYDADMWTDIVRQVAFNYAGRSLPTTCSKLPSIWAHKGLGYKHGGAAIGSFSNRWQSLSIRGDAKKTL